MSLYTVIVNFTGSIMVSAASKEEAVQMVENMGRDDVIDDAEELGFSAFAVLEEEDQYEDTQPDA